MPLVFSGQDVAALIAELKSPLKQHWIKRTPSGLDAKSPSLEQATHSK